MIKVKHPKNKYKRQLIKIKKLKLLYLKTKNYYGCGAYYNKGRLIKYTCSSSYWKNHSNRIIRRKKLLKINNGAQYKKLFDYWWTIL